MVLDFCRNFVSNYRYAFILSNISLPISSISTYGKLVKERRIIKAILTLNVNSRNTNLYYAEPNRKLWYRLRNLVSSPTPICPNPQLYQCKVLNKHFLRKKSIPRIYTLWSTKYGLIQKSESIKFSLKEIFYIYKFSSSIYI